MVDERPTFVLNSVARAAELLQLPTRHNVQAACPAGSQQMQCCSRNADLALCSTSDVRICCNGTKPANAAALLQLCLQSSRPAAGAEQLRQQQECRVLPTEQVLLHQGQYRQRHLQLMHSMPKSMSRVSATCDSTKKACSYICDSKYADCDVDLSSPTSNGCEVSSARNCEPQSCIVVVSMCTISDVLFECMRPQTSE